MATAADSTVGRSSGKGTADFPLWLHKASGQWAKKIRGRTRYFGQDRELALRRYLEEKPVLEAGGEPGDLPRGLLELADACNLFLGAKELMVESRDITRRHWNDLRGSLADLVGHLGRTRAVDSLTPKDFALYRAKLAKRYGPSSLKREVAAVKQLFNWLYQNDYLDVPVKLGTSFKAPSARSQRLARQRAGSRLMDREELTLLLEAASPYMKAFILLALNAGLGNRDVAFLEQGNLEGEWLDYPRNKTGIGRKAWLWPETKKAITDATQGQRKPKQRGYGKLVFVTRCGNPWSREDKADSAISKEYRKLLDELGLYQRGRTFYGLRHIHRTITDEAQDPVAANFIMGHVDNSMAAQYRERISDARIKAVCEHVRLWLFGQENSGE